LLLHALLLLGNDTESECNMSTSFQSLGLEEPLLSTLAQLHFKVPSYIQAACIPSILQGKNVIGVANTGCGKTAAFVIPIISMLSKDPFGIFALCLCPTRELAYQIAEQLTLFSVYLSVSVEVLVGGEDVLKQSKSLLARPNVVVATPGRLVEHLIHSDDIKSCFLKLQCLILDEADRLLDASFDSELRYILANLPRRRQTLMFSATITSNISALQTLTGSNVVYFEESGRSKTVNTCEHLYSFMPEKIKDVYLVYFVRNLLPAVNRRAIIFTSTIQKCELISQILSVMKIGSLSLHSVKRQAERRSTLSMFKSGIVNVLVATDVAARGLDIPAVHLVINYDLSKDPTQYIHRVGRTARFQAIGKALTLVTQYDVKSVKDIEKHIGKQLLEISVDEEQLVTSIGEVFAARKLAKIRMATAGGFDETLLANKRRLSRRTISNDV